MAKSKPWLKKNEEKTIKVMGVKITLKNLSFGDSRKAMKEAMKVNMVTKQAEVDASLVGVLRALYAIKDWELTDEDDKKLPITLETFDNVLSEEFVSELLEKFMDENDSEVSEAEKKK